MWENSTLANVNKMESAILVKAKKKKNNNIWVT